jgi:enhancing lycopene biosynthesis protein 2
VHADVARIIPEFHDAGKPIGLICIAPVLAARVLGTRYAGGAGSGCSVTLGEGEQIAQAVRAMGSTHVAKPVTAAHVDHAHRIVTTPAYMCDAKPHEVFAGIGALVDEIVTMVSQQQLVAH